MNNKTPNVESHYLNSIIENSAIEKRVHQLCLQACVYEFTLEDLRKKYDNCYAVDVFFLKSQNGGDIGFALLVYFQDNWDKRIFYIRPSIGIIPTERGTKFPTQKVILRMLAFKMKKWSKQVYVISVNTNPIAYAGLCNYWNDTFPNPFRGVSKSLSIIKERSVQIFGFKEIREHVVQIPVSFIISDRDKQRFENGKDNPHINFFFQHINDQLWNKGILTITPINPKNVLLLMMKISKNFIKKLKSLITNPANPHLLAKSENY